MTGAVRAVRAATLGADGSTLAGGRHRPTPVDREALVVVVGPVLGVAAVADGAVAGLVAVVAAGVAGAEVGVGRVEGEAEAGGTSSGR